MQEYIKLQLLTALYKDDAEWQANVVNTVGDAGYTIASDGDCGDSIVKSFDESKMQAVTGIAVYDFAGGAEEEEERFYIRDNTVVYKHNDGTLWLVYTDDVYAF